MLEQSVPKCVSYFLLRAPESGLLLISTAVRSGHGRNGGLEHWHSNVVDGIAKQANLNRSPDFWAMCQQHVQLTVAAHKLHSQACALHLVVAKGSVQADRRCAHSSSATNENLCATRTRYLTCKGLCLAVCRRLWPGLAARVRVAHWWTALSRSADAGEVR